MAWCSSSSSSPPRVWSTVPAIVRADPPEVFDNAVLTAVKKWKFKPKIVGGRAVPRRARQEVRFSLPKE